MLSNFLKIKVLDKQEKLYVYYYEFSDNVRGIRDKKRVYSYLKGVYKGDKSVIVSMNALYSMQKINGIERKEIEGGGYGNREMFVVDFKEKIVDFDFDANNCSKEKETICNNIFHEIVSSNETMKKKYSKDPKYNKYIRKEVKANNYNTDLYERRNKLLNGIDKFYKETEVRESVSMTISHRDGGLFLIIEPNHVVRNYDPNANKLINMFCEWGIEKRECERLFRTFSISRTVYRNVRDPIQISKLNFDLNPLSPCDFSNDFKNYKDYIFKTYGPKSERGDRLTNKGITSDEFDDKQPIIEIVTTRENRITKKMEKRTERYIPSLVQVDCRLKNDDHFNADWSSQYTNMDLKRRFEKIDQLQKFLQRCDITERMKEFNIELNFNARLQKVNRISCESFDLCDISSRVFHRCRKDDAKSYSWRTNNIRYSSKVSFEHLLVLYDKRVREYAEVFGKFENECKQKGIKLVYAKEELQNNITPVNIIKRFINNCGKPRIILCFPQYKDSIYHEIMEFALNEGIVTQFMLGQTMKSKRRLVQNGTFSRNLFRQVYSKLGNSCWFVKNMSPSFFPNGETTIVIGIDVSRETHRTYKNYKGERKNYPNTYVVVATCPKTSFSKRICFLLREKGKEISGESLGRAIKDIFDAFWKVYKRTVDNLIIFRDGVAENQIPEVRRTELKVVNDFLGSLKSKAKTKLAFLICQKRISCLLTTLNYYNPIPGSYVNDNITFSPQLKKDYGLIFDFYFSGSSNTAMASIPLHISCLHNDYNVHYSKFPQMTIELCSLLYTNTKTCKNPYVSHLAHCLSDKIYKAILGMDGDRRNGFKLDLNVKFLSLLDGKIKDGSMYEEEKENTVQILIHKDLHNKFFELDNRDIINIS